MNKFGSKTFKLSLVVVFGFFVIGLLVINFILPNSASVSTDDLTAGVSQSNMSIQEAGNGGTVNASVKCEGYGYCTDKIVKCGDGTTCTMVAICHKTVGCAYSDCCAGHGGYN